MAISLTNDVTKAITERGTHIVIHAVGGVGKTTQAAEATKIENGIMLLTGEDGLSPLKIADVPHINIGCSIDPEKKESLSNAWNDYLSVLKQLMTEKHSYKYLVQEPLSSLMGNIFEGYITNTFYGGDEAKANAYGAKYQQYQSEFNKIIECYKILLNKGMSILTMCHSRVVDFKDPSTESYKKWELALPIGNKVDLAATLFNHADAVFFGQFEINVDGDKHKATGGNKRILRTSPSASYTAKNMRLPTGQSLPDTILFDYKILKTLLTKKGQ